MHALNKKKKKSSNNCKTVCITPSTHTQVHKHAPLHPHKTVAIAQINIIDLPWMCLAVTGTL